MGQGRRHFMEDMGMPPSQGLCLWGTEHPWGINEAPQQPQRASEGPIRTTGEEHGLRAQMQERSTHGRPDNMSPSQSLGPTYDDTIRGAMAWEKLKQREKIEHMEHKEATARI